MFYGQGAGKLPTASAVVSDVVDAVKHLGTNIISVWSTKKLELANIKEAENRFFVRLPKTDKQQVEAEFGKVQYVETPEIKDETAFLTGKMKEKDFDAKIAQFENVHSTIRAEL